jgi:hypothetical protein
VPHLLQRLKPAQPLVGERHLQHVTRKFRQAPLHELAGQAVDETPFAQRGIPLLRHHRADGPPLQQPGERAARLVASSIECKEQGPRVQAMHRALVRLAEPLAHECRALPGREQEIEIPHRAIHR